MSAECGCNKVFKLGCFPCGQSFVQLPFDAPSTGTYTAAFTMDGYLVLRTFEAVEGEQPFVPIGGLNEDYFHRFYVLDENDTRLDFTDAGVTYDCIGFRTKLARELPGQMLSMKNLPCEQFTDPTYGLTKAQLLECILALYVFSDEDTIDALSAQQVVDLIAALCSGGGGGNVTIYESDGETVVVVVPAPGSYSIPKHGIYFESLDRGPELLQEDEFNEDFTIGKLVLCNAAGVPIKEYFNHAEVPDTNVEVDANGNTRFLAVLATKNVRLPDIRVAYLDTSGTEQTLGYFAVEAFDVTVQVHIDAGILVPRITIYEEDGVTVHGYVDVADPFFTLPAPSCADASWSLRNSEGTEQDNGTIPSGGFSVITAQDASYALFNTNEPAYLLGSDFVPSGKNVNIIAPPGVCQLRDTAGGNLGDTDIPAGTSLPVIAPNGTVSVKNSDLSYNEDTVVLSGGAETQSLPDLEHTDSSGSLVAYPGQKAFVCTPWETIVAEQDWEGLYPHLSAPTIAQAELFFRAMKFVWEATKADTIVYTVQSDDAKSFTVFTDGGGNGTVTYKKNGGSYVAFSGTVVLTAGDTITLRRTTTTSVGTFKIS